MADAGIGRLLLSSLHHGIGDVLPTRLEFYESWLSPAGMRARRFGLAPLGAVLSFVHREGPPTSDQIAICAGACAADWTFSQLSARGRRLILQLPTGLRIRAALWLGRRLVWATVRRSKVSMRRSGGAWLVEIRSAIFDQLRDPASIPMRGFYAAALQRLLAHCAVDADVEVVVMAAAGWRLAVTVRGPLSVQTVNSV